MEHSVLFFNHSRMTNHDDMKGNQGTGTGGSWSKDERSYDKMRAESGMKGDKGMGGDKKEPMPSGSSSDKDMKK